jgi:NAD(P)-dependent dehydrogenase (short-subunit alcohol dehydrogenase family)
VSGDSVVTGAGGGAGRSIARKPAADGARAVVNDLDVEAAAAVTAVKNEAAIDAAAKELNTVIADEERHGLAKTAVPSAGYGDAGIRISARAGVLVCPAGRARR